ncbi:MAG: indole-3-glycerol-phosphate synthase [Myxococcota bacterium]
MTGLERFVDASRARAAAVDRAELRRRLADAPPPRPLPAGGFTLIAEVKPRSPDGRALGEAFGGAAGATTQPSGAGLSFGVEAAEPRPSNREPDVERRVDAYLRGGAGVVSVLTEPRWFGGALDDLRRAATRPVPVLRKDFVVDEVQVDEARAAGASAVLLIARIVDRATLARLVDRCGALGMVAVVEWFDAADAARSAGLPATFAVNARDLDTLGVDPGRFAALAPLGPSIAASGLSTPDDVRRVRALGYTAALVGSALMRDADPEARVRALVEAACT